jgi:hypothetical protein
MKLCFGGVAFGLALVCGAGADASIVYNSSGLSDGAVQAFFAPPAAGNYFLNVITNAQYGGVTYDDYVNYAYEFYVKIDGVYYPYGGDESPYSHNVVTFNSVPVIDKPVYYSPIPPDRFVYDTPDGEYAEFDHYYGGVEVDLLSQPGSSFTIVLSTTPGVPEPASWSILLLGLGLVAAARRRQLGAPA